MLKPGGRYSRKGGGSGERRVGKWKGVGEVCGGAGGWGRRKRVGVGRNQRHDVQPTHQNHNISCLCSCLNEPKEV